MKKEFEDKIKFFKESNSYLFFDLIDKIKQKSDRKQENYLTLNISFYEIEKGEQKLEKSSEICDFIDKVKNNLLEIVTGYFDDYIYQRKEENKENKAKYHTSLLNFLIDEKYNFEGFSDNIKKGHIITNIIALIEKEIKNNKLKKFEVCLRYLYVDKASIALQCFDDKLISFLKKMKESFNSVHNINWQDYVVDNKIKLYPSEDRPIWGNINLFKKFKGMGVEKAREISEKIKEKNNDKEFWGEDCCFTIDKLYLVLSDPYFCKSEILKVFSLSD